MRDNKWQIAGKGLIIGATMIVPGVSGGTMAIILGIYDRLISAVSSFRKNVKENFLFLFLFAISAGVGLFLFTTPLSWLLENYEMPTTYFFIGAVAGGIPLIERKSGVKKIDLDVLLYLLVGALVVTLLSKLPQNLLTTTQTNSIVQWFFLIIAGIVSAAALVLPGISFSHFLLILGLYEQLLHAVKTLEFTFLIPLAAGVLLGILLFSKMLEHVMEKYPKETYLLILGFIVGSVAAIYPGIPSGVEFIFCIATVAAGFFAIYRKNV